MADVFAAFIESYPSFNRTRILDEWRETEYGRLDANGQIYLDYTGGGLYSDLQLHEHMELLRTGVLGNPHSANPTSLAMTDLVEGTRKYVFRYFNASSEYPGNQNRFAALGKGRNQHYLGTGSLPHWLAARKHAVITAQQRQTYGANLWSNGYDDARRNGDAELLWSG